MMLRGYRHTDRALLSGDWLPGELLGQPPADRPGLTELATMPVPKDHTAELYVIEGVGVVRFAELDWIHRRTRVEIGLQAGADDVSLLLKEVLTHGFEVLNLNRVFGYATPAAGGDATALTNAGFRREAILPEAGWLEGRPVDREIWGAVRHG